MDGCYSDNLPSLGPNTITVSPFSGDADICPPVEDKDYKVDSQPNPHIFRDNIKYLL